MSNSPLHDSLIKPVKDYLAQSMGMTHFVVEMGKPQSYPRSKCWPSVDIYAHNGLHTRSVVVDVKVTRSDCLAQLKKPYVQDPSLCVGFQRYIACPAELQSVCPDGWGLLSVHGDDAVVESGVAEGEAWPGQRNMEAEAHYIGMSWRNRVIDEQGRGTDRGIAVARGKLAKLHDVLRKEDRPMMGKELAGYVEMQAREVCKLLDKDPEIHKADGFPTYYSLQQQVRASA